MAESNESQHEVQCITLPSNGWIVSFGSRTPSEGTTAGIEMGAVIVEVGVTVESLTAEDMIVTPV